MVPHLFKTLTIIWLSFCLAVGLFFLFRSIVRLLRGAYRPECPDTSPSKPLLKSFSPRIPGYPIKTLDGTIPNPANDSSSSELSRNQEYRVAENQQQGQGGDASPRGPSVVTMGDATGGMRMPGGLSSVKPPA